MKKIVLSALILAGLMLTSCDKNDDNNTTEERTVDVSKMYLPLKMVADGYTRTFIYNNKGQITNILDTDGYEYSFTYNGNQLISFESIDPDTKTTYTFKQNGNKITVNLDGNVNGEKVSDIHVLEIDAKGNLMKDEEANYTYDSRGNSTKVSYGEGEEIVLTFDDKNGIYKNLNLPKWVSTYLLSYNGNLVNNFLSHDYKDVDFPEDNNSSKITYEYNADGYPTKITSEYKDEAGTDSETQTIEYTKK